LRGGQVGRGAVARARLVLIGGRVERARDCVIGIDIPPPQHPNEGTGEGGYLVRRVSRSFLAGHAALIVSRGISWGHPLLVTDRVERVSFFKAVSRLRCAELCKLFAREPPPRRATAMRALAWRGQNFRVRAPRGGEKNCARNPGHRSAAEGAKRHGEGVFGLLARFLRFLREDFRII